MTDNNAAAYLRDQGIYDHIEKIVDRVVAEKPKDAYALVEVLSRVVREPTPAPVVMDKSCLDARANYVERLKLIEEVPAEEGTPIAVVGIPDFMEESEMLAWAGVGFGKMEAYKIMCSLRGLAHKEAEAGYSNLRFWGKILGSHADYYIAEAAREGGGDPDPDDPDPPEPAGTGANSFMYYVTTDLCEPWEKLPDIKPSEIVAARRIKKLMTGDRRAKVITQPFFPGAEEVLLRAQIARITADTVLCIKGKLIKDEDDDTGAIKENEEFVPPLASELLTKGAWSHMQAHILLHGRTTHKEPPEEDEDNPEQNKLRKKMLAEQEADPEREVIRDLNNDDLDWVIKQVGDTALYKNPSDAAGQPRSNAVTVVRSVSWPGANTVACRGLTHNIYVGYAISAGEPDFFPSGIPDVQDEPDDPGEEIEPQGTTESVDAEKEEEG